MISHVTIFTIVSALSGVALSVYPVVTWHGIGSDSGECNRLITTIREAIPDVHILNVAIGNASDIDHANSILMKCNDQIDRVCQMIQEDPLMADGFNSVGISQGGLLARGLAERCPVPTKTLITFGAPHQGVFGVPDCESTTGSYLLCEMVRQLIAAGVYTPWIQNLVTPAQYYQDPLNITNYIEGSRYLAPINNHGEENQNADYKTRIENLVNFVMVMFNQDETVIPKESAFFEFYTLGQDVEVQPLNESAHYQENWLGLRTLDESGRLHFFAVDGGHVQINYDWVAEYIIPFLL